MNSELIKRINNLKEKRNAVILAHNYQKEEIQDIADYTGDSLGLSRQAAETEAEVILFCGVDFMAESAALLSPDKTVLLPEKEAGCPMAEMITAQGLKEIKEDYPEASVVCYVNSSAAVKAESDVCCTSSNAVEVVSQIDNDQIIFVPDQNLGQYVAKETDKEIILWEGFCATHHRVQADNIQEMRKKYPDAVIAVHPECRPEVVAGADFVGSTAQLTNFSSETEAEKVIVGTEKGLLYKLRQNNPAKEFYLLSEDLICQNMKLTSLESVVSALENMQYEISVFKEIARKARLSLDRMLELS